MLKSAIYLNVFIIFVVSIYLIIQVFKKDSDLKKLLMVVILYMIFDIISICLFYGEIVDTGWNLIFVLPVSVIVFIINIISVCFISTKLINSKVKSSFKKYIILSLIPVIVFLVPYLYELYIINNCEYLIKYNYQGGIVQSDDSYLAIINHKPVTITLQNNLFNREANYTKIEYYEVSYTNGIVISTRTDGYKLKEVANNDLQLIALDAQKRHPNAKGGYIEYFKEGNYAIIELTTEDGHGILLGEYFYYNNTYVKRIQTHGNIESIAYFQ